MQIDPNRSLPTDPVLGALRALGEALDSAVRSPGGQITVATEAHVHKALHALKAASCDLGLIKQLEALASTLRIMMDARRDGRVNLYASKLVRLRHAIYGVRRAAVVEPDGEV